HRHAKRRSDRLTFDEQETIAIEMGYGEKNESDFRSRAAAAERLMQDYYRHARVVTRGRERVFERARPSRRRHKPIEADLGQGVRLFDGHVTVATTSDLQNDPPLAFRVYAACVEHGASILPFTRQAIARMAADSVWCDALRKSPEAVTLFVEL